jgi:nicotinamide riboside kinase
MKKIALTGSHGTGKSTLAEALTEKVRKKFVITHTPEIPRLFVDEFNDKTLFRRERNTFGWQTLILSRQIEVESLLSPKVQLLVCDRTIVDHWAYTKILFPRECATAEGRAWAAIVARWVRTYDRVFRLPIEFAIQDDGVREDDLEFQREIDRTIETIYYDLGVSLITISGSVAERLQQLENHI